MNAKKVETIVARVLGVKEETISDETSPANTEEWDSFNGLLLATELEKEFDVRFSIDEVVSVKKLADIKAALRRHGKEV